MRFSPIACRYFPYFSCVFSSDDKLGIYIAAGRHSGHSLAICMLHNDTHTHECISCGSVLTRLTLLINVVAQLRLLVWLRGGWDLSAAGQAATAKRRWIMRNCLAWWIVGIWVLPACRCAIQLPAASSPAPPTAPPPSHWRMLLQAMLSYVNLLFACPSCLSVSVYVYMCVKWYSVWLLVWRNLWAYNHVWFDKVVQA